MQPFTTHEGRFITLDRANVDTDQIIPARYLKRIERTGYGDFLFEDIGSKDGRPNPDFPLHRPEAKGATVLVARQNFGCGSSREHAVWAISQHGFRAVIAPRVGTTPGFADIFRGNSTKNGLLCIEVDPEFADRLFAEGSGNIAIDLETQTVVARLPGSRPADPRHAQRGCGEARTTFEIAPAAKTMLLEGLDEIGLTLQHEPAIAAYENRQGQLLTPSA